MDEKTTSDPITRRAFAQRASAAALVPIVVGLPYIASGMDPEAEAGPAGRRAGAPQEAQEDEEPPGVDALLDHVRALYGERLTDSDLAVIRDGIAGNLRAGLRLRDVPLTNSDGPAIFFQAYRSDLQ